MDQLTRKQKQVIGLLQKGECMLTSLSSAQVTNGKTVVHMSVNFFYDKLVNKGYIQQQLKWPFDYVLTEKGRALKI